MGTYQGIRSQETPMSHQYTLASLRACVNYALGDYFLTPTKIRQAFNTAFRYTFLYVGSNRASSSPLLSILHRKIYLFIF
jgi:hypothetical protein